jgi:hypothetical protein
VIVTVWPPVVGPEFGFTAETVGAARFVKPPVSVPDPALATVTTTFAVPADPAGVVAVSDVEEFTDTPVAEAPPTVTVVAPATKFEPVTVIPVPPAVGPMLGDTCVTVGGARYVNALPSDPVPPLVVTATVAAPAEPAGVTAVSDVAEVTLTLEAAAPPTVTVVAPTTKFVPATVTAVPPDVGPTLGDTTVTLGVIR